MTTGATSLLGLALPVQGELDGTWGDVVNTSITELVDSAVAGTTTLSADSDVTLTTTSLAANQARQAILLWTASNGATTRNITAPAQSKSYIVVNAGTGSVVLRGAGPTTGVTVVSGEKCLAAWNGSDFVKISSTVADGVTSVSGTGTVNGITLTGTVTSTGSLTLGGTLSGVNLASQVTGTLPVANGGTGSSTLTANNVLLGNGTSALQAVAPGTSGYVLTSDGTTWSSQAPVGAGPSTATYTNRSTDLTLTSADANKLLSFTLANDITVTMPDATTLTLSKNFEIKNNSTTYGIYIKDSAGTYLFTVPPSTGMYFWTTSIATAAGAWVTDTPPVPYLSGYTVNNPKLSTWNNEYNKQYCATLNSTQAIMLYNAYSGLYAVVVTNTSGTISYGTATLVTSFDLSNTDVNACIAALTATTGIIVYPYGSGGTRLFASKFTVSGTTITINSTYESINATNLNGNPDGFAMAALSSTTAALYYSTSTTAGRHVILSLSGDVITFGTEYTGDARSSNEFAVSMSALSSTSYVLSYNSTSAYVQVATVSGTVITLGTPVAANSAVNTSVAALSSTSFVLLTGSLSGAALTAYAGTVSGTTITLGTGATLAAVGINVSTFSVVALSSTTAMAVWNNMQTIYGPVGNVLTISGTAVSAGASNYTFFSGYSGITYGALQVVGLQTIAVGSPSTSSVLLCAPSTASSVVAFRNQNATVSGTIITVNTVNSPLTSGPTSYAPTVALSKSQFIELICLPSATDATVAAPLYARLYGVSGSTFTLQNTLAVSTSLNSTTSNFSIFPISSTLVCVLYTDAAGDLKANTVSISGSTMTLNTAISVATTNSYSGAFGCTLSGSLLLVGYTDDSNSDMYFVTLSLSGTTLTLNTATQWTTPTSGTGTLSFAPLSATRVATLAKYNAGAAAILDISITGGTNVAVSLVYNPNSATTTYPANIIALSSTRALASLTYQIQNATTYQTANNNICIIEFPTGNAPYVSYEKTYSTGIYLQPNVTVAACSPTSGVLFGYNLLAASGSYPAQPIALGRWTLGATSFAVEYDTVSMGKYPQYSGAFTGLTPLVSPAVGYNPTTEFALLAYEASQFTPSDNANGLALRKYSVAGTVNA